MNWSDEKYVKVYTRDTLTWLSLSWEARAVLALLFRKVDGAGLMETGSLDRAQAVALQLVVPADVTRRALDELIAIGTVSEVAGGILIPNFVEAQESTKTEARKKKDQRQRVADQRRLAQRVDSVETHVPQRPAVSPGVPECPPPAQPTTTTTTSPAHHQPTTTTSPAPKPPKRSKKSQPVQGDLPVVPPAPPAPPPKSSWQQALYDDYVLIRWDYLEQAGLATDDEPPPHPAVVNTTIAAMVGDLPPERRLNFHARMAEWFCRQPWGAAKDGKPRDPPWPWRMFASEKVWKQARAFVEAEDNAPLEEAYS